MRDLFSERQEVKKIMQDISTTCSRPMQDQTPLLTVREVPIIPPLLTLIIL
jgi:hypothetical protein